MHRIWDYKNAFRILKGGKISLVVSAFLTTASIVHAAPTGGNVTSGNATISQNGNVTNINQSSNKASINWQDFSIGKNETVNFNQPNSNSITLNKVVGTSNSLIQGAMNANGQVILVNPNGVVFTEGSNVNVGGLIATTKNITEQEFQNGNYKFEGDSSASIINKGTINAKYVAMMGKEVVNEGKIVATMGRVELSSGDKFTLNLNGDSLLKLTIDEGTLNALVENKGLIKADGGVVYLTTQALDSILDGMVNNTGVIEAQSLSADENGEIILFAHGGTANIGGTIKAEGGFVETSGKEFAIQEGATIQAGEWLIDPVNITIDSTLAGAIETALGSGDVTITTDGSNTPSTTSGESGTDGDIFVNSEISWASSSDLTLHADRDIYINADITATDSAAKLTLEYGQGAVAAGNTADYNIVRNVSINLQDGQNFSTKLGSDGTVVDYTVISNPTAIMGITTNDTSVRYALGADVDLTSITWTSPYYFQGHFSGLGHTIDNFSGVSRGFFEETNGATIRDLGLTNVDITSTNDSVGALIGSRADQTTIKSVYATGVVNGRSNVGGLAGWLRSSTITDSYSTVVVNASQYTAGGLVGWAESSNIENSYASGDVTGSSYVGGLVGYVTTRQDNDNMFFENVYALGDVTASDADKYAGGLIGEVDTTDYNSDSFSLTNAFATGKVDGTQLTGGLIGNKVSGSDVTLTNSYWDTTTTEQQYAIGSGTDTTGAIANANAYTQTSYTNFDFTNDWFMVDGYTRPFLRMEWTPVVSNAHQLQLMLISNTSDYKLANDINLQPSLTNASEMWRDVTNASFDASNYKGSFEPIGASGSLNGNPTTTHGFFNGSFDGQNFTISNLYQDHSDVTEKPYSTGLFGMIGERNGQTKTVEIKNLILTNVDIKGVKQVAALVGRMGRGTIDNIEISGNIIGTDWGIGSIIGYATAFDGQELSINDVSSTATITGSWESGGLLGGGSFRMLSNSHYSGDITGDSSLGGLVGYLDEYSNIENSWSSGTVVGTGTGETVGGLAGILNNSAISNSYSTSTVTGISKVGGLVGSAGEWGGASTIDDSYATGTVTGTSSVGGFVGEARSGSEISNSYATGAVTGSSASESVGGFAGYLYGASVDRVYATGDVTVGGNNSQYIGGLVGYLNESGGTSIINESYATGDVGRSSSNDSTEYTGGLVGYMEYGQIFKSFATGNVEGFDAVGGFVGGTYYGDTIHDSYATGSVTGLDRVGGFIGDAYDGISEIQRNYATGAVSGITYVGGFAGRAYYAGVNNPYSDFGASNNFWDAATTGQTVAFNWHNGTAVTNDAIGISSDTTAMLKTLSTYSNANWDIVIEPSLLDVYPQLRWATNGLTAGSSVWVIGKTGLTYVVTGGTKTYGETFTLPTPSFTGGTPSGNATVKVFDAQNNDVTAGAIAGTLPAGTYSVKTVSLVDNNYNLANSGNTDGTLVVGKANLTYTTTGGTKTYGETFTLPTPSFTGGTPSGNATVKVFDAQNNDVTAGAIAGTLPAGTYSVKTVSLVDNNYNLANSGNTDGTLVVGKANLTYTTTGGTKTYGQSFTLPNPTFVGGTPSGNATVKVFDANNNDVTAQAIAGTLAVGTYTVKTVSLNDNNYGIASSGNVDGILTIVADNSGNNGNGGNSDNGGDFENPTTPISNNEEEQEQKVNDIITNIVNNAVKPNLPVLSLNPIRTDVVNGFERRVNSIIVNNRPQIGNENTLGTLNLGLNEIIRSVKPAVNEVVKENKLTIVGETGGESKIEVVELQDLVAQSGGGELRVALSPNSFVELVNGGVNLPDGVSQEFYVVEDKK